MAKKQALGKGIASLLKTNATQNFVNDIQAVAAADAKYVEAAKVGPENQASGTSLVDVSSVHANPGQPRKIFKDIPLKELAASIKENGIIQPLIVTKRESGGFEVIAGERRLRAAKLAGLEKVPVLVKKVTDREKLIFALIENVQRSELNCIEEGLAYYQLMEDFSLSQEEVAKKMGKDRSTVANHLRVLKLPREVIDLIQKEKLSFGHAKVLAGLKETEKIRRLAFETIEKNLSVRELEKLARKKLKAKPVSDETKVDSKQFDHLREKLEKNTGFHFNITQDKGGQGSISIKYTNEAEFNDIYDFLMNKR